MAARNLWLKIIQHKFFPAVFAFMVGLSTFFAIAFIQKEQSEKLQLQDYFAANHILSDMAKYLETQFDRADRYMDFFAIFISGEPSLDADKIKKYSLLSAQQNPYIASLLFAPKGIVEIVHPETHEAEFLGLNLFQERLTSADSLHLSKQPDAVRKGPLLGRDNEQAFLCNYKGVFYGPDSKKHLWGVLGIALDFDFLIGQMQQQAQEAGFLFALRTPLPDGGQGLWGDADIFNDKTATETLAFADSLWEIAVKPQAGWKSQEALFASFDGVYYVFVLLFAFMGFISAESYQDKMRKSRLDPLTGTLNRLAFHEQAQQMLHRQEPFALLILDLNGFKQINDSHGHYIGDQILQRVSRRLSKVLQSKDYVSRFGGDEFIVLINLQNRAIEQIYPTILSTVEQTMIIKEQQFDLEFASGYALYPDDGSKFSWLYRLADQRMYQNKKSRKTNRHPTLQMSRVRRGC